MVKKVMKYLEQYNFPADLKKLSRSDLNKLAQEIREFMIEKVSKTGGHLAPSLGVVELAIALHAVLDTPKDKLIWDVGHQAYAHKILTGRMNSFATLRQFKGISGFPKPEESEYDSFIAGHASTSISAALGFAKARDLKGEDFSIFSVIGDGSFSGGLAMEAINNMHSVNGNFVVILNDNDMSIAKPVGALSKIITRLRLSSLYRGLKSNTEKLIQLIPMIGKPITKKIERLVDRAGNLVLTELVKDQMAGFFHDLGFTYLGPVNGHNIPMLMTAIKYAKDFKKGPILIHINTKKGKGYKPAEEDPTRFHGLASFDVKTGAFQKQKKGKSWTDIFSEEMLRAGQKDKKVIAITAAMPDGTGLTKFAEKYPERFFDVGIAEEHAVTFAAGLAKEGLKPVVAIYSTFLQRAYDQIIHDVALQKLPLFFALDRGGIVGEDGPTHQGLFDLSYLRHIPNLIVSAPKDGNELKDMISLGLKQKEPFTVRYPRGEANFFEEEREAREIEPGIGEIVHGEKGAEVVIWAIGSMVSLAVEAAKESQENICVVNARFVKPLDKELLKETAKNAKRLITIEENVIQGGFGSAVVEAINEMEIWGKEIKQIGIEDKFVEQGTISELRKQYGLTVENIVKACSLKRALVS